MSASTTTHLFIDQWRMSRSTIQIWINMFVTKSLSATKLVNLSTFFYKKLQTGNDLGSYGPHATTRFDGLWRWFPSIVLEFRHYIFTDCATTGLSCSYVHYIGIYWVLCLWQPYSYVYSKMVESGNHVEKLILFSEDKVVLLVIVHTNFKELAKITPPANIDVNYPLYLCSKLFAEGDVKRQSLWC